MRFEELIVRDRILLHLGRFSHKRDEFVVPEDVTQTGIARTVGKSRAHAALMIKELRSMGLVMERMAHVKGGKSRRKAYFPTIRGEQQVKLLQDKLTEPVEWGMISTVIVAKDILTSRQRLEQVEEELRILKRKIAILEASS
ncbi:MAG: hypothetical protein GKC03_00015 [Methanomassiliicoccales archaeon]|nr:hypothetical protein [Methanomassiliicoccales archaeon]